jgi:hypothetical protein
MSNNPLGELANFKQIGSVEDYQRQFQTLLARTHDLKPRQQVDLFTAGLIDELRIDIELQQPGNLGVAMNLARAFERKLKGLQGMLTAGDNMNKTFSNYSAILHQKGITTKEEHPTKLTDSTNKASSSAPIIKRLTRAEMAETV